MTELKPLGVIREIIIEAGLEMSYAYDDLVFVGNSLLIIRFATDSAQKIELFFNRDIEEEAKEEIGAKIIKGSLRRKINCVNCGHFTLKEDQENEQLTINFFEAES